MEIMELIGYMSGNSALEWYRLDSKSAIENLSSLPSSGEILYSRRDFDEMGLSAVPRVLLGRE